MTKYAESEVWTIRFRKREAYHKKRSYSFKLGQPYYCHKKIPWLRVTVPIFFSCKWFRLEVPLCQIFYSPGQNHGCTGDETDGPRGAESRQSDLPGKFLGPDGGADAGSYVLWRSSVWGSVLLWSGCPHWATVKAAGKFLQFTEDCSGRRYAYSILSLLPFLRQIQRSSGPCAKPSVRLSPTHSSVCLVWSSGLGPRRSGRGRTTTPTRNTRRT